MNIRYAGPDFSYFIINEFLNILFFSIFYKININFLKISTTGFEDIKKLSSIY